MATGGNRTAQLDVHDGRCIVDVCTNWEQTATYDGEAPSCDLSEIRQSAFLSTHSARARRCGQDHCTFAWRAQTSAVKYVASRDLRLRITTAFVWLQPERSRWAMFLSGLFIARRRMMGTMPRLCDTACIWIALRWCIRRRRTRTKCINNCDQVTLSQEASENQNIRCGNALAR